MWRFTKESWRSFWTCKTKKSLKVTALLSFLSFMARLNNESRFLCFHSWHDWFIINPWERSKTPANYPYDLKDWCQDSLDWLHCDTTKYLNTTVTHFTGALSNFTCQLKTKFTWPVSKTQSKDWKLNINSPSLMTPGPGHRKEWCQLILISDLSFDPTSDTDLERWIQCFFNG